MSITYSMMSLFEVYLDIRQPAPEAAKPSAGSGVELQCSRQAVVAGRFFSCATATAARQLYVWCMEAMNRTLCYFID